VSKRSAPFLLFPTATSIGTAVAIAVPVSDDAHNLFVSYNFEANYNVVNTPEESFPGKLVRFNFQKSKEESEVDSRNIRESFHGCESILITRVAFYRVVKSVLDA
jgi:hypothetical protein